MRRGWRGKDCWILLEGSFSPKIDFKKIPDKPLENTDSYCEEMVLSGSF